MLFFFFKQKTAYEMRISDWSSDVCSSDLEIEKFRAQEYWSVEADFRTRERRSFTARLTQLDGRKLDRLDLGDEGAAKAAVAAVEAGDFEIGEVEKKRVRRNPQPPFTTSTLQPEASRKLGFGPTRTMQPAQRLYEGVGIGGGRGTSVGAG